MYLKLGSCWFPYGLCVYPFLQLTTSSQARTQWSWSIYLSIVKVKFGVRYNSELKVTSRSSMSLYTLLQNVSNIYIGYSWPLCQLFGIIITHIMGILHKDTDSQENAYIVLIMSLVFEHLGVQYMQFIMHNSLMIR